MNILEGLFYTKEHEWVHINGRQATVGISDYAQHSLGDITFVELPAAGTELTQGQRFSTIESVKAASDVYSPVSGRLIKINQDIVEHPELVNQSPYGKGWFAVIEMKDDLQKNSLMDSSGYRQHVQGLS
jgi:glycine cleavage system H protein